jgi:hypothetical protein
MSLKELITDIFGVSVTASSDSRLAETPISVFIAAATVASSLKTVRDFAVDSLGLGGAFLPALTSIIVFAGCIFTVSSKKPAEHQAGFGPAPVAVRKYAYGVWTRRFAKAALLLLVFIIPMNIIAGVEQTVPLQSSISGVLLDAKTREPVEGAQIRLVLPDGVDVTDNGDLTSDSRGVFVVTAKRRIRRSAVAMIYREGCKPVTMGLWKRFETSVPTVLQHVDRSTSPFFTFYTECQG